MPVFHKDYLEFKLAYIEVTSKIKIIHQKTKVNNYYLIINKVFSTRKDMKVLKTKSVWRTIHDFQVLIYI